MDVATIAMVRCCIEGTTNVQDSMDMENGTHRMEESCIVATTWKTRQVGRVVDGV